ncbi:MAG: hypothetical protein ACRBM6_34765 [Geminicoccales bacterium]
MKAVAKGYAKVVIAYQQSLKQKAGADPDESLMSKGFQPWTPGRSLATKAKAQPNRWLSPRRCTASHNQDRSLDRDALQLDRPSALWATGCDQYLFVEMIVLTEVMTPFPSEIDAGLRPGALVNHRASSLTHPVFQQRKRLVFANGVEEGSGLVGSV